MMWVCRLNNCNARFVRETDLKRHQTTSLAHRSDSEPIRCPQCDSTFTRMDALKRHQRSRHNGAPGENNAPSNSGSVNGVAEGSASSTPKRRSMSPAQSGDSNHKNSFPVPTIMTQPEAPGRPTGTQSYYSPEMVTPVFLPSRIPNGNIKTFDSQIPQLFLPPPNFQNWVPVSWATDPTRMDQPLPVPDPCPQPLPYGFFVSGTPITNMQFDSAAPPSSDGKGNTTPSLPPRFDNNIDPSLRASPGSTAAYDDDQDGSGTLKDRDDAFARAGLSPAVQKVLKAVLAFETGGGMTQLSSDTSTDTELEEDLQKHRTHDNDSPPLPEGIRELINEDSLSYAPPS